MSRTYLRTIDDQQVSECEALDSRGVLRDGYRMRTKLMLRDGVPSTVDTADVLRKRDQIDKYNAMIGDAWRNPPQLADVLLAKDDAKTVAPHAAKGNAYERYEARLQDAWR